jgi:hypothetical protein
MFYHLMHYTLPTSKELPPTPRMPKYKIRSSEGRIFPAGHQAQMKEGFHATLYIPAK